jgi:hypothetical protein
MNNYINKLLLKYNHLQPKKLQHSPQVHWEITNRAKEQLILDADNSLLLDTKQGKWVQGEQWTPNY